MTDGPKKTTLHPPVPAWKPAIVMPNDRVVERLAYYTNGRHDIVCFSHSTCAVVPEGLCDADAERAALGILAAVFGAHPDMSPAPMDDDNIVVRYNHPLFNVVLMDVVEAHWPEIEARHLDALATSEVLLTPLGANKFDRFGMAALLGRCFFFMDAQDPQVVAIRRHAARA